MLNSLTRYCPINDSLLFNSTNGFSQCSYYTYLITVELVICLFVFLYYLLKVLPAFQVKDAMNSISSEENFLSFDDSEGFSDGILPEYSGDSYQIDHFSPRKDTYSSLRYIIGSNKIIPFVFFSEMLLFFIISVSSLVEFFTMISYSHEAQTTFFYYFKAFGTSAVWILILVSNIFHIKYTSLGDLYYKRFYFNGLFPICFLIAICETLTLINWYSELWPFHNITINSNLIQFIMLIVRLFLMYFVSIWLLLGISMKTLPWVPYTEYCENNKHHMNSIWAKLQVLWPILWPSQWMLRGHVLICVLMMVIGRVVNLYMPKQYKVLVDFLTQDFSQSQSYQNFMNALKIFAVYILLYFIRGGSSGMIGLINNLRSLFWINVRQYTTRILNVDMYTHIFDLTMDWHIKKKTGEVIRKLDRCAASFDQLLNYLLFSILPPILDMIIAVIFFAVVFNFWFSLIIFLTISTYFVFTFKLTTWRNKLRREINEAENITKGCVTDALMNFETVKYFCNEEFEINRYDRYIKLYQKSEWKTLSTLALLNTVQNICLTIGFAGCCIYCVYLITKNVLNVGDFVMLVTYLQQLYTPLQVLGNYYGVIQNSFIDMENTFEILQESPEVKKQGKMREISGRIEFKNVSFGYDLSRMILKNICFEMEPGTTLGIVGPSGAGKSSLVKLLYRFYDITKGKILIDGRSIQNLPLQALRSQIGIVPQDATMFNESIKYNIQYGRIGSFDDEIVWAAKMAEMDDKILTFQDQYDSLVGEKGLKLSGGEKQRITIARIVLKDPKILILDEATSSLDSKTEALIQKSLEKIRENRTTIIIAHRLSTIKDVDQILVLKDGQIIERGKHDYLLKCEGFYAEMWNQQIKSEQEDKL